MTSSATRDADRRIAVRVRDEATAELVSAEAFDAGVAGIEEHEVAGAITLWLYATADAAEAVCRAVAKISPDAELGSIETVVQTDWAEQWKAGLAACEISPRLRVRPSFVEAAATPDQWELIIDPGQAFGTGSHPSTHLALEWIDALAPEMEAGWRLLDVGTGTGVLSLAALRLGAASAVAFDLDPLSIDAARENARNNGLARGLSLFIGPLDAISPVRFDLIAANLLRTELMPLIEGIEQRLLPAGRVVFSGLLRDECERVEKRSADVGLRRVGERSRADANGDVWSALLMSH